MKLKVMLDEEQFSTKPTSNETGGIVSRICNNFKELSSYELATCIHQGMTIIPAYLGRLSHNKIRKTKECWSSQQLVFLDFDNTKYVPDPLPNKPNNKKKIKDIQITIEQAKKIFKDSAMFIYKTFNYQEEWPKFRVVIALDRTIHNKGLMQQIFDKYKALFPYIDSQTLEHSRLFYGGIEVIEINYNNLLNVDTFLETIICDDGGKRGVHNNLSYIDIYVPPSSPIMLPDMLSNPDSSNINIITTRNIKAIQSRIEVHSVNVSRAGLYDYLYRIDFSQLLGVDNKHCCLYHNDNKPSAVISINPKTGHYVYKCFSCGWTGNIITCIEKLFEDRDIKIKRSNVVDFLKAIYKIDIKLDEWGKQQKSELESNIDLLLSGEIEELEPHLYKLIVKNIPNLISLHHLAIQNIVSEEYTDKDGNVLLFKDVRGITAAMGKSSKDKVAKDINFYTYLGMLNKVDQSQIPKDILLQISKYQFDNNHKYKKNCYSFPSYTNKVRKFADIKAIEWKDKGYVKKHLSREMIMRGHGKFEADRVYPQMNGEEISEQNQELATELIKIGLEYIEVKGWTTEKEIEDGLKLYWKGQKQYKEGVMKTIRSEFLESYGLVKSRLNKHLANKLNIIIKNNNNGNYMYPNIIYKNESIK